MYGVILVPWVRIPLLPNRLRYPLYVGVASDAESEMDSNGQERAARSGGRRDEPSEASMSPSERRT